MVPLLLLLEVAFVVMHLLLVAWHARIVKAVAGILIEGPAARRFVWSTHPWLPSWLTWWPHETSATSCRTRIATIVS